MPQFALFFRMDILSPEAQPSAEEMEVRMASWMEWLGWIESQGKLVEGGNHFASKGAVLRPGGVVSKKPYVAENQSVAGLIMVRAKSLAEAVRLAQRCPILDGEGTSVEVREAANPS